MPNRNEPLSDSPTPSVFASEIEGFTTKNKLSRRESDILVSLIRNVTNSEDVAKALGISTHTVNNHLKSIFEKTSTKSKTEILSTFLRFAADRLQGRSLFVRRPRVLIIDSDSSVCSFVASGLMDRGMRVQTLNDASRALDVISKFNIDFVICDNSLPELNGMAVLKAIRQTLHSWPHFVFMSDQADVSLAECMHQGAAGIVEKPLHIDQLFRIIMGHLAESGDERAEQLVTADAETVVLGETYSLEDGDLGFGGAFIPMDSNGQKKARLAVGSVVDLSVSPAERLETLKIRGQVAWKRTAADQGLKAGVGIRFIKMNDRDQTIFDNYLMTRDLKSFIPRGGVKASV